jgi:hypothetical protein
MAVSRVYRSAVDTWLVVVLGAGITVALVACGITLAVGDPAARAIAGLALVVGAGLPIWVLLTTCYTLAGDQLLVQSGPFRTRVPIGEITAITPTSNPLSSPALSLARLRIDYGQGRSVMISPADRAGFLADLDARRATARAQRGV